MRLLIFLIFCFPFFGCSNGRLSSMDTTETITFTAIPNGKIGIVLITNTFQFEIRRDTVYSDETSYYWDKRDYNNNHVANSIYLGSVRVDEQVIATKTILIK